MPPVVCAQLDYYAVLEVPTTADVAEINAAFRRLAWRCHPDLNPAPGATLQFQAINEAHQVLSDPERRAEYDAKWHSGKVEQPPRPNPVHPRPHARHYGHRARKVRNGIVIACAMLFVSTAWALIYSALSVAHDSGYGMSRVTFEAPLSSRAVEFSADCTPTMEIVPINYVDERGRASTLLETDLHACWGGSTRLASVAPPAFAQP